VGPADQGHVPKRETQKIYFQKVAISSTAKSVRQHTTIRHKSTTTSPRFNHQKTRKNRKTPCKKRTSTTPKNIPLTSTQKLLH
jgi:hypothetical protein